MFSFEFNYELYGYSPYFITTPYFNHSFEYTIEDFLNLNALNFNYSISIEFNSFNFNFNYKINKFNYFVQSFKYCLSSYDIDHKLYFKYINIYDENFTQIDKNYTLKINDIDFKFTGKKKRYYKGGGLFGFIYQFIDNKNNTIFIIDTFLK